MEKKKVRLYRAQEGGQPPVDMMGYPGSEQEQQQLSEDQVLQMVMSDISQEMPKAAIVNKLVNGVGLDVTQANQYVESVYAAIEQQKEQYGESEETEDEEEREVNETEGKLVEEEEEEEMENIEGYTDLAMEDAEGEQEYLTQLEDEDMMRYGGMPRMQYGGESGEPVMQDWDESEYPVYFPGVEAYLPSVPYDYSNDAADTAWQAPEFQEMEQEEIDYSEPAVNPEEFRYGGYKTKKGYVNNVLRLVKKQLGGDQEEVSDDADPRGEDYRTNHLDAFLGSIKREGNVTLAKEKAEQEYEQAMQQYQMMMSPQQEALSQYIPQGYEIPEAQFGMQVPQGFRNQRQYARFMRNLPMGAAAGMAPVSKIDVTRSGLFGRPRRYSVEFDTSPLKAMAANPMMAGVYGYGMGTKTTRTPARVITETVSKDVNNKATEEVANATKSDAATTSATNGNTTNTSTQANPQTGTPNKTALGTGPTVPGTEKPVVVPPKREEKEKIKPTETITPKVGAPKNVERYQHMDTGKSYFYDPKNKKWYRGESKTPITDKKAIENLNRWEKKGIVTPVHMASNYERKQLMDNIYSKPQSIVADDELISTLALFGTGSLGSGAARAVGAEQALLGTGERVALNAGQRMLNPGQRMLNVGQRMLNPGQRMLNPGQKLLNPPGGFQYSLPFQQGGFVDSANPDLYRFVYGGYDPSIPQISQDDIDYMYARDTSDAYFQVGGEKKNSGERVITNCFPRQNGEVVCLPSEKTEGSNTQTPTTLPKEKNTPEVQTNTTPVITNQTNVPPVIGYPGSQMMYPGMMYPQYPSVGGYLQNIIPANLGRQYYSKYLGTRGAQGMPMMPQFGPNTMIKKVDVTKSGLFGQPKRYSVTFTNPEMDPTKQNVITLDNSAPQTLSAKELRRDEKQAGRQRPLRAGKKYEQYFEDRPSTQEDFDRQAKYNALAQEQLSTAQNVSALLSGRSPQAGMSQEQIQQVQNMMTNPSGLPEYADTPRRKYDNPSPAVASAPVNEGYWKDGNWYESKDAYGKIMDKRSQVDKFVGDWAKKYNIPEEEASMAFAKEVGVFPAFTNLKDIEKYDQIYNQYVQKQKGNKKQYGGNLNRFIPQAQYGGDSPVVYTNNPALEGLSDVDIISLNPGIPGLGTPSWAEPMPGATQMPTIQDTGAVQPKQYTEDPMQANRNVTKKTYAPPAGDFTMDFKTKSKVKDPQAEILAANAAIEGVTGMINRFRNKDREAELYKNLTADNLYAQKTPTDRGDYDTNTGLYRPDEQGQTWNSRSAQFGGSMEPYTEGDEVYMTDEELQEFLKNGGEVEYI